MASEIRVNKIINRSGLSTVTFTDDGAIVSGIVSASVYTGSGANLTDLPAGNLSGTLPAISATNLTNVPAANITGTLPAISAANLISIPASNLTGTVADARISTLTASKLSGALPAIDGSNLTGVGASFGNSSVNTSGIVTATAFVPTTGQLSHRNIIINGAMTVAQRGTSSASSGFQTVDRFGHYGSGWDEAMTQSQSDVASGTTPYTLGFRKAFKLQNGNQTGGAGTGDQLYISHKIEAQNIATSGWNYTSASSYITLSFWVKSSVAQNFYGYLKAPDGTAQNYPFETGSLSANTWTKVTKTIPGNSNLQFDLNALTGLEVVIAQWFGTDKTGRVSLNAWGAWNTSIRLPDMDGTMDDWYETNDATFEYTGVQLEVGPVATPFEHRSFGDELIRCQRYCQKDISTRKFWASGNVGGRQFPVRFQTEMRDTPTISFSSVTAAGSFSAGDASRQGYNTYMSGTERYFEWRHTATAEL